MKVTRSVLARRREARAARRRHRLMSRGPVRRHQLRRHVGSANAAPELRRLPSRIDPNLVIGGATKVRVKL